MDNFTIIFIVVASLGIFIFYKLVKLFIKKLVGLASKQDEGKKFVEGELADDIAEKFAATVEKLEAERAVYYGKTKGLFKRAFFKTWLGLAFVFIALAITLNETGEINAVVFIGPSVMAALLSLIGAGIYTLVKKGGNSTEFTQKLKQELVAKIVNVVNPNLEFYGDGIKEEEFNKADIFPDGKNNTSLKSEDKIEGTIDGTKVIISECIKQGRVSSTTRTNLKIKGVTVSTGSLDNGDGPKYVEYFRGLFIQMDLNNMSISAPLKVVPENRVRKKVETGIDVVGRAHYIKTLLPEDKLDLPGLENKPYSIYCGAKDEANQLVTDSFIKILDFVYEKYNHKRDSNDSNSIIGKMLFRERAVYITLRDNMLYMALDWNKDMFETDAFLKKNLIESGIAQEIYEDLMLVNQVVKEVNLFNKIAV